MKHLEISEVSKLIKAIHAVSIDATVDAKTRAAAVNDHRLALLAFTTGGRISQLLALKGSDIFQHEDKIVVMIQARKGGNDGVRDLRIDADPAFDLSPLVELAKTRGTSLLFEHSHRSNFNLRLKRYGALAGIHPSFCHSHVFRHSVAVALFDATQRVGVISEFLLHASPATAFQYLRANDNKRGQEVVNAVNFTA
jgi:integrase